MTSICAEKATQVGPIQTKEGASHYRPGDCVVYNKRNGRDGYCMTAKEFNSV
jgi:hydrogenase maturation factor